MWKLVFASSATVAVASAALAAYPSQAFSSADGSLLRRINATGSSPRRCSAAALPAGERARMAAEYDRRVSSDGKASADAWAREQANRFRRQLVAEGVCPSPASRAQPAGKGRNGADRKGCQMTQRMVPGFGGSMTMVMVPDCH